MGTRQSRMSARAVGLAALVVAMLAAVAVPSSATAENVVNVTIQNPADLKENPCAPSDWINFQSTLHIVLHMTADRRGGYHVGAQSNWVASGASIVTGVEYRGSQTIERSAYVGAGEKVTWIDSVHLVSQATTEDFLMHVTYHLTVSQPGVPTVLVDNVRVECKG